MTNTATLNFTSRDLAQSFATSWAFHSKTGYTLGSGKENVSVTLYNVDTDNKLWIDSYVENLNKGVR